MQKKPGIAESLFELKPISKNVIIGEKRLSDKDFTLTPEEVPKAKRLKKGSKYDPAIDDFLGSQMKSARVDFKGVKSSSVLAGIKNRIDMRKLKDKVDVVLRSGKVYLRKKSKA